MGRAAISALRTRVGELPPAPPLSAALGGGAVAVIAEVKRRSPSKGSINEGIRAADRARAYEAGGAAAISVLTEPTRFGGTLDDLAHVRAAVKLPILRKDFISTEAQLLEARASGASAALLIARGLASALLADLAARAREIGLEVLVEVRDEAELADAIAIPDAVIGVNARDLETLEVEAEVTARLIPTVPRGRIVVHESGVSDRADVERAASAGADAVLVGSLLSRAADAAEVVRSLTGVSRRPRG